MSKHCPSCHAVCDDDTAFCGYCGSPLTASDTVAPSDSDPCTETDVTPEEALTPTQEMPADKKTAKKEKKPKKEKKKGRFRKFLKFLLTLVIIAAVLLLLWVTLGKWLTLRYHSDQVTEALNAGSLDFPGSHRTDYDDLPDYAKDMLGEDLKTEKENDAKTSEEVFEDITT